MNTNRDIAFKCRYVCYYSGSCCKHVNSLTNCSARFQTVELKKQRLMYYNTSYYLEMKKKGKGESATGNRVVELWCFIVGENPEAS